MRQADRAASEEYFEPGSGRPRGVLRSLPGPGKFRHVRRRAAPELEGVVDHYWMVWWDLTDCEPQVRETLPHPNFHVVFEQGASVTVGVHTGKFSRRLEGRSHVFGIKFRAGLIRPWLPQSASRYRNNMVPVLDIFGEAVSALEKILVQPDAAEKEMVEAADEFLLRHKPPPDAGAVLAYELVEKILADGEIRRVEQLAQCSGHSQRALQRIFHEYVGATPKWVIRRYRLHELVERIHAGGDLDWTRMALDLGYFDQAHLINDFRILTGYSPTDYQKRTTSKSEI